MLTSCLLPIQTQRKKKVWLSKCSTIAILYLGCDFGRTCSLKFTCFTVWTPDSFLLWPGNGAHVSTQLSSTADRNEPLVWRLKRPLAQITCLKDALEPVHFGENLVRDQCRHADELCSGVARGAAIMAGACRIISGAPMNLGGTNEPRVKRGTRAHHL